MADVHYVSEDMTELLTGLNVGGTYLNAATVTYALKTAAGAVLAGGTGSYTYTPGSDGNYTAVIESTVTGLETAGATYYLEVTIVSGNYNGFRRLARRAVYRGPS